MRLTLKAAALVAAIAPAILRADVLLNVDFDSHPAGPYTRAMAASDFPGASWYNGMDEGWGEIVPGRDGRGKALRMKYPAGQFGPNNSAIQIKAVLGRAVDTAWASYWVKFEDGFDFVKGGKLPGLCGGECITGGNDANGYNGWSARVMWRREGVAVQYMYYVTNEGYGEDLLFDKSPPKKRFAPGQWHRVNTQIVMNTPGAADGVIRTWFDGELSMERKDIIIRHIDTLKIDQFYISTFFGGSDNTWAPGEDMYITYDDFLVVSKQESSPYPQVLYELSATSGRVPAGVTADLSASLGSGNLAGSAYFDNEAPTKSLNPSDRVDMIYSMTYYVPKIANLKLMYYDQHAPQPYSSVAERTFFALGEYDILCDSAWQAMPIKDTLKSGERLRVYLDIVDTTAAIIIGPAITGEPRGEYSFFGVLKYENGKFGALDSRAYIMDTSSGKQWGRGTYIIEFTCDFTAMTYSVSVDAGSAFFRWENLGYRGYAKSIGSYGTWASRDQAAAVHMESWKYGTGAKPQTARPASNRLPSVKVRKNVLILSASGIYAPAHIEIFNAKGALVKRASTNGNYDLFIPVKSKGLYLYRVKTGGDVARGVVVVR